MSYEVIKEVINFREVVGYLNDDEDAFILIGTGGYHGTHKTLSDCERILKDKDETWLPGGASATILIINPREVTVRWGEIHIRNLKEVEWLRKKVREGLEKISITQEDNK